MEDLGAKIAEKRDRLMSKEAKLVRGTHIWIQRLVLWVQWRVEPVEREVTSMGRMLPLSTSIPPHPRLRSRTSGNLTVCE